MNNHIRELEQNLSEVQQRIDKIQTEINSYQQTSLEHLKEIGTIFTAIESMFDLVKKYGHRCRKKDLNNNEDLFMKLNHVSQYLEDIHGNLKSDSVDRYISK